MIVRVPASSANLGPGFDTLGMALGLHVEAGLLGDGPDDAAVGTVAPQPVADEHHPITRAFHAAGGAGRVWVRGGIPMGRGLGYSGAVRVAGVVLAHVQREGADPAALEAARASLLSVAAALEGHADNAAASLYGGVVATAGDVTVCVPLALDPAVVVWVPESTTSTDASRSALPDTVTRADAVFNLGRTAVLVAALARGQVDVLRTATEDRLHQEARFVRAPGSRVALAAGLEAGAWCGWLSGSGPTVALLCPHDAADRIVGALPAEGRARYLRIDHEGACVIAS